MSPRCILLEPIFPTLAEDFYMTALDRRNLLLALGGILLYGCRTTGDQSVIKQVAAKQALVVRRRWVPGEDAAYKKSYIQAVTLLKANDGQTFPDSDPRSFLSWEKLLLLHQKSCQHKTMGRGNVGRFEGTPHNGVHNTVGGIMANTTDSPRDPVFWLHHCNIDRVWTQWVTMHPEALKPFADPSPAEVAQGNNWSSTILVLDRKESLPNYVPPQSPSPKISESKSNRSAESVILVKDLLDIEKFSYVYDSMLDPTQVLIVKDGRQKALKKLRKTIAAKNILSESILQAKFTLTKAQASKISDKTIELYNKTVNLVALNLPIPTDDVLKRSIRLRFFVLDSFSQYDKKKFFTEKAFELPEYVGSYTFFSMGANHRHGNSDPTVVSVEIDITEWLEAKLRSGDQRQFDVAVVAVNSKADYKAVTIFNNAKKTELQIQAALDDAI
ncbi:MAG: hypothetical protein EOP07_04185 [Proteobacteria bacterium]|nr:MAG: hypothetical protein EOP07_04185 [Pseudomonadota bacterium]